MNKPLATALLATSSLLLADGALAADACGTPRNAFDSVYCRSGEFSQADRELNQQFGTLRKHLNDGQKALLKKSQIAWIKEARRGLQRKQGQRLFRQPRLRHREDPPAPRLPPRTRARVPEHRLRRRQALIAGKGRPPQRRATVPQSRISTGIPTSRLPCPSAIRFCPNSTAPSFSR